MRGLILLIAVGVFNNLALAKIGDPPGLFLKNRIICSHANEIFALQTSDPKFDCQSYDPQKVKPKMLWKKQLPFKFKQDTYDPKLEQDVQWCIVTSLSIENSKLVATNCRGKQYFLNPKNGKLIQK